jgi:hypothetical protein
MLNFVQAFLSHFFSYLGDKKRKIQTFIQIGRVQFESKEQISYF